MFITLPELPYPTDALEPYISGLTVTTHYNRHHAAYVNRTNELLSELGQTKSSLVEIIHGAHERGETALFNNAAQAWNHEFYWNSLRPNAGGPPTGTIAALIDADFSGFDLFVAELRNAAAGQFGSGWVWVVLDSGHLKITHTPNADTPLVRNQLPVLAIDVWEHAYYLDYQQRRDDYVSNTIRRLLNWDFANQNLLQSPQRPLNLPAVHAVFNSVFPTLHSPQNIGSTIRARHQ